MATFDDVYETLYVYSFDATDTPQKAFCRPDVDQRCWRCEKTKPEVKFSSDAHVIPAMLGNRSLFSLEECDKCNNDQGKELDQGLADYLTLWRAVSRIRTRKGTFKHRTGKYRSYIEGYPSANKLLLELYDGEDSIGLVDDGNGHLLLRVSVPPASPLLACKALARMAWFCLPKEDRDRAPHLRRWVLGELDYLPTFYEAFLPGTGQRLVTLRIYRARSPRAPGVAPYLVQLDYGSIVLLLPLPDDSLQRPAARILPDIPHSPFPPHVPKLTANTVLKGDKIPRHMEDISISYARKHVIDQITAGADPTDVFAGFEIQTASRPPMTGTLDVTDAKCPAKLLFIAKDGGVLAEVRGYLGEVHLANDKIELRFADDASSMRVTCRSIANGASGVQIEWENFCELPLEAAVAQLRLRQRLSNLRTMELRALGSDAPLMWSELSGPPSDTTPSIALEIAERLALIARKTGASLMVPERVDDQIAEGVEFVSSAVEFGEFIDRQRPTYDVPMNARSVEFLEHEFKDGKAPQTLQAPLAESITLLGQSIPMGELRIGLVEPKLTEDLVVLVERLRAVAPPNLVMVPFAAKEAIIQATRFMPETSSAATMSTSDVGPSGNAVNS